MASLPVIHLTASKGYSTIGDCCICAIATLSGKEYEDVVAQAVSVIGEKWKKGMWQKEIIQISALCGLKLKRRRKFDMDTTTGILNCLASDQEHVVVLMDGKIYDNDLRCWDVDAYQRQYNAVFGQLLEVV